MYFFIALVWLYGCLLLYCTKLWNGLSLGEDSQPSSELLNCDVVVPFRNEEGVLYKLIESLKRIDFPKEKIVFHFIDDHSTDSSLAELKSALFHFPFKYHLHEALDETEGKKSAQLIGIEHATSNIILCTDADCEVPTNWVLKMQEAFHNPSIHMVTGNITFSGSSFWSAIMRIEFAPLIGITAVGIRLNHPILANGANMAFRKDSFLKVLHERNDIKEVASGDDTFLLEAIKNHFGGGSVRFIKSSPVLTAAPSTWSTFYFQRIRWAAKWNKKATVIGSLPAILVWLFHLTLSIMFIYGCYEKQWTAVLCLILPKVFCEYLFIKSIFKTFSMKLNIMAFAIVLLFYSIYVIFFGLTANFGRYKWKERVYG